MLFSKREVLDSASWLPPLEECRRRHVQLLSKADWEADPKPHSESLGPSACRNNCHSNDVGKNSNNSSIRENSDNNNSSTIRHHERMGN